MLFISREHMGCFTDRSTDHSCNSLIMTRCVPLDFYLENSARQPVGVLPKCDGCARPESERIRILAPPCSSRLRFHRSDFTRMRTCWNMTQCAGHAGGIALQFRHTAYLFPGEQYVNSRCPLHCINLDYAINPPAPYLAAEDVGDAGLHGTGGPDCDQRPAGIRKENDGLLHRSDVRYRRDGNIDQCR